MCGCVLCGSDDVVDVDELVVEHASSTDHSDGGAGGIDTEGAEGIDTSAPTTRRGHPRRRGLTEDTESTEETESPARRVGGKRQNGQREKPLFAKSCMCVMCVCASLRRLRPLSKRWGNLCHEDEDVWRTMCHVSVCRRLCRSGGFALFRKGGATSVMKIRTCGGRRSRMPQAAAAMSGAATDDGADCADDVVVRPCRSWGRQIKMCGAAASGLTPPAIASKVQARGRSRSERTIGRSTLTPGPASSSATGGQGRPCALSTRREVLHVYDVVEGPKLRLR